MILFFRTTLFSTLLFLSFLHQANAFWPFDKNDEESAELRLYGNVDIRQVDTAFEVSGRIVKLAAEEGAQVTQNQILATLKSQRYQQQFARIAAEMSAQKERLAALLAGTRRLEIDLLRARVDAARAEAENASQKVRRLQTLVRENLASQDNLDDAQSAEKVTQAQTRAAQKELDLGIAGPRKEDIAMARAQLEALQATLALARIDLDDTTLFAPQAGVIRERLLQVGDMAGPQRPVFGLALTDPVWVRAYAVTKAYSGADAQGVSGTAERPQRPFCAHRPARHSAAGIQLRGHF